MWDPVDAPGRGGLNMWRPGMAVDLSGPAKPPEKREGRWLPLSVIWITQHWAVQHIVHLYEQGVAAGSDQAVVIADLAIVAAPMSNGLTRRVARLPQRRSGRGGQAGRSGP